MHAQLRARLRSRLGIESLSLTRYRRGYEDRFPAWTQRVLSPKALTAQLLAADLVLLGDYHSLTQSQRTALRLLKRMVRKGRFPALGLEFVPSNRQAELDRYQAGLLDEARFLDRIGFSAQWTAPWPPLRTLLRFAAYHRLPVLALDSRPRLRALGPGARDQHAARVLARYRSAEPERPLFVLMGDFHLADRHLPAALHQALAHAKLPAPSILRVFQNHEPLFWESLARLRRCPEILELAGGDVCIQSATPLIKLQSFLQCITLAELGPDALRGEAPPDPAELLEDLSHEVAQASRRIARFLAIPTVEQPPARIFWIGQADFAGRVAAQAGWTFEEMALVQSCLERGEDCYLRSSDVGILAELGENRIEEMAARVLHGRTANVQLRPRSLMDDFYLRVLQQALIWLGSKILNPLRKAQDRVALRRVLAEDDASVGQWKRRSELLLGYLEDERDFVQTGSLAAIAGKYFGLEPHLHMDLTRAVGRNLGGRLYEALIHDRLDRYWLRRLWVEPFHLAGSPLRLYLEILEQLGDFGEPPVAERDSERL